MHKVATIIPTIRSIIFSFDLIILLLIDRSKISKNNLIKLHFNQIELYHYCITDLPGNS